MKSEKLKLKSTKQKNSHTLCSDLFCFVGRLTSTGAKAVGFIPCPVANVARGGTIGSQAPPVTTARLWLRFKNISPTTGLVVGENKVF